MSEKNKLYEVGQKIHHDDKVTEVVAVREVTLHHNATEDQPAHDEHQHYEYTLRDHSELQAEREAAEAARTGHEDAPEQEDTDVA